MNNGKKYEIYNLCTYVKTLLTKKGLKTFRNNESRHLNGSPCMAVNTVAARIRHVLQRGDPKNLDRVREELEQSVTLFLEVHTNNLCIYV